MIAVVDYRAGNLTSVRLAFESLKAEITVTSDPTVIDQADRVVFPGVGAAGSCMQNLHEMDLSDCVKQAAANKPFLGICLGMQLLLDHSEEDGGTDMLGIIPGKVQRFRPQDPLCKIPQMGWNSVGVSQEHPLLKGIENESEFYFVHSYYCNPASQETVAGQTQHADVSFASAISRNNLFATQFHPERSGRIGLRILENFCEWDGTC